MFLKVNDKYFELRKKFDWRLVNQYRGIIVELLDEYDDVIYRQTFHEVYTKGRDRADVFRLIPLVSQNDSYNDISYAIKELNGKIYLQIPKEQVSEIKSVKVRIGSL